MDMNRMRWWALLAGMLLAAVGGIFWLRIPDSVRARGLLLDAWGREALTAEVTLTTPDGTAIEGLVFWCTLSGQRYGGLRIGDAALYYHNGVVYAENGRGYDLTNLRNRLALPPEAAELLLLAGFRRQGDGYLLTLEDWRRELLEEKLPDALSPALLDDLALELDAPQGQLSALTLHLNGYVLHLALADGQEASIPPQVVMAMTGPQQPLEVLLPLWNAGQALARAGSGCAALDLTVDCGLFPLQDTAALEWDSAGLVLTRGSQRQAVESPDPTELLLGLAWALATEGTLDVPSSDSGTYGLKIPAEVLNQMLTQILPELDGIPLSLKEGLLSVRVAHNALESVTLTCSGEIHFLVAAIPLELELALTPGKASQ